MPIRARCTDCDKGYTVDEKNAGRTLKCKACGGAVKVPATATATATPQQKPARPAAKARPVPAAAPAESAGDAFGDMDALLALESGGTVMEDQPALAPPPPLPAKPARAGAAAGMPPRPGSTVPKRRPGWQANNDAGNGITAAQLGKILGIGGGVVALIFVLGLLIKPFTLIAFMILVTIGGLLLLSMWAGCLMCAAREECLFLYILLPYYPIYFVLTRIEQTKLYLLAGLGGIVCMAAAVGLIFTAGKSRERAELPHAAPRVAWVAIA
jgi:hypothetical protein